MIVRLIGVAAAVAVSVALHLIVIGFWSTGPRDVTFDGPLGVSLDTDGTLFGDPILPLAHPYSVGSEPAAGDDVTQAGADTGAASDPRQARGASPR